MRHDSAPPRCRIDSAVATLLQQPAGLYSVGDISNRRRCAKVSPQAVNKMASVSITTNKNTLEEDMRSPPLGDDKIRLAGERWRWLAPPHGRCWHMYKTRRTLEAMRPPLIKP